MSTKLVAYYRVSTDRQARSGLGLEAQRADVEAYRARIGGHLIAEFTEVESGRRCDRAEFAKALCLARAISATLVVAKLDRLARNVAFTARLLESKVDFIACDNPHAAKLTIHILAAVAEDEAERIAARVKAALAAYKARGGLLGGKDPRCRGKLSADFLRRISLLARTAKRQRSASWRATIRPVAQSYRRTGLTLAQVADRLNGEGYATISGNLWNLASVWQLLRPAAWEAEHPATS